MFHLRKTPYIISRKIILWLENSITLLGLSSKLSWINTKKVEMFMLLFFPVFFLIGQSVCGLK